MFCLVKRFKHSLVVVSYDIAALNRVNLSQKMIILGLLKLKWPHIDVFMCWAAFHPILTRFFCFVLSLEFCLCYLGQLRHMLRFCFEYITCSYKGLEKKWQKFDRFMLIYLEFRMMIIFAVFKAIFLVILLTLKSCPLNFNVMCYHDSFKCLLMILYILFNDK